MFQLEEKQERRMTCTDHGSGAGDNSTAYDGNTGDKTSNYDGLTSHTTTGTDSSCSGSGELSYGCQHFSDNDGKSSR